MLGIAFNATVIVLGTILGRLFKNKISPNKEEILNQALGLILVTVAIGICSQQFSQTKKPIIFILSLIIGGLLGTTINLENKLDGVIERVGFDTNGGIATATILFCVGSLAILGPINIAINNDYTFIMTNSILDGVMAILLAEVYGWEIIVPAGILFILQSVLYVIALLFKEFITKEIVTDISLIGGILLLASGIESLGGKKFHTLNFIPALLVVPLLCLIIF
ncbi:DUF554 domain-containing protein [Lactiplantibacillus plantarum]|nr:DUF554 domain-containing protein [Lactiplantibacillus plantarum]